MNRRCVIFAGLAVPPHLCQDIGPQDVILAADAGWKTARALGFAPTLALGDFDTAPAPKGPDVLRLPAEKDDTDTFFAARKALEMGCSEVLILGGIGGRLGPYAGQHLHTAVFRAARRARLAAKRNGPCAGAFAGAVQVPRAERCLCVAVPHVRGRARAVPARVSLPAGKRRAGTRVHPGHKQ